METFLTTIIGGLTIPVLAFAFKIAFDRWLVGRSKEVTVELANGKIETFTVDADAGDAQIVDEVHSGMALERDVAAALKKISLNTGRLTAREGKHVDFLVQVQGKTLAIECKTNVDQIGVSSVEKYLEAEGGSGKLLLVSRKPAPPGVLQRTGQYIESGKLSYIYIPTGTDVFDALFDAVSSELRVQRSDSAI